MNEVLTSFWTSKKVILLVFSFVVIAGLVLVGICYVNEENFLLSDSRNEEMRGFPAPLMNGPTYPPIDIVPNIDLPKSSLDSNQD